jgi:PAS domain-containing protein
MRSRQGFSSEGSSGRAEPAAGESTVKPARAALLAAMSENDFLNIALNAIEDIFGVFDLEGTLVGCNENTKSISGYSDEELSMKQLGALTSPEDQRPTGAGTVRRAATWSSQSLARSSWSMGLLGLFNEREKGFRGGL